MESKEIINYEDNQNDVYHSVRGFIIEARQQVY